MALSLVGSVLQSQTTGTSATLQIPSLASGDLVVVFYEIQSSSATVTPHTGFTQRQTVSLSGTTQSGLWAWPSDTTTTNFDVTFSHNGTAVVQNMEVWVWHSSVASFTTSAIDKTNTNSGTGTALTTGSTGTLSTTSQVAVAAAITATNNGATEAIDSSFTLRSAATHNRCVLGDRIVTADTALNPSLSWATSLTCAAMIITFAEPTVATNAAAGAAQGTGAAGQASVSAGTPAGSATATGAAHQAATTVSTGAAVAAASGQAQPAAVTVGASAGAAAATGTANNATVTTGAFPTAGTAVGTGAAHAATIGLSAPVGHAAATGSAFAATISTETPPYARLITAAGPWPPGTVSHPAPVTAVGQITTR